MPSSIITEADGILKDRLDVFMLIVREYRHAKMGKRAGRGHDPSGLATTSPAALLFHVARVPNPVLTCRKDGRMPL